MTQKTTSNETRDRILDAAQDLIRCRGLNAMSFQDLSDAVGIRKASVHYHFPNKDAMVEALLTRYLESFDIRVSEILHSRCSGKTQLRRFADLFQETLASDQNCLCGMLMAEVWSLDSQGRKLVQRFLESNTLAIQQMIRRGVEDGSLSPRASSPGTSELVLATIEGGLLTSRCDGGCKRFATVVGKMISLLVAD